MATPKKIYGVKTINGIYSDASGNINVDPNLIIEKTVNEMYPILGQSLLKSGMIYKITGFHSSLYNDGRNLGTTIYVKALDNKTLDIDGIGEFYNPSYNTAQNGFNIWHNRWEFTYSNQRSLLSNQSSINLRDSATSTVIVNGFMYIANYADNSFPEEGITGTISKVDIATQTISHFAIVGLNPNEICTDGSGNIWVCNNISSGTVKKITSLGSISSYNVGPFPTRICSDGSGNIWVFNSGNKTISKIDSNGNISLIGTNTFDANAIVVNGLNEAIYILNAFPENSVTKFLNGEQKIIPIQVPLNTSAPIKDMVIDGSGNVFVCMTTALDNIVKIDTDDKTTIYGSVSYGCDKMKIDISSNNIYVMHNTNGHFSRVNAGGDTYTSDGIIGNSNFIDIDYLNGSVFMVDTNNMKIMELTSNRISSQTNESISADGGNAYGQLIGSLSSGSFVDFSNSNWSMDFQYIKLNASDIKLFLTNIKKPTVNIDELRIYGGYVWKNLTGNIGTANGLFNLDSTNWIKLDYVTGPYNKVFNKIRIDFYPGRIIYREDVYGNIINNSLNSQFSFPNPPIQAFQWGNERLERNIFKDSYLECINFQGDIMKYNNFDRRVNIQQFQCFTSSLGGGSCSFSYNNMTSTNVNNFVIASGGIFDNNKIDNVGQFSNVFISGTFTNNSFINNSIVNIILSNNSNITYNIFGPSVYFADNNINNSSISNNNFINGATIMQNTMWNSSIQQNYIDTSGAIQQNSMVSNSGISGNRFSGGGGIIGGKMNGSTISSNNLIKSTMFGNIMIKSTIENNELLQDSSISNNYIGNSCRIINNYSIKSTIDINKLYDNGEIISNNLSGSNIIDNILESRGNISYNNLNINSRINENHLTDSGAIEFNLLSVNTLVKGNRINDFGRIQKNKIYDSTVTIEFLDTQYGIFKNNDLNNTYLIIENNTNNKEISNITSHKFSGVTSVDLSTSTIIYAPYDKVLFTNQNTPPVPKLRYFNDSDVQTVALITD